MGRVNYGPYIFDEKVRLILQTFFIQKLSRSLLIPKCVIFSIHYVKNLKSTVAFYISQADR